MNFSKKMLNTKQLKKGIFKNSEENTGFQLLLITVMAFQSKYVLY